MADAIEKSIGVKSELIPGGGGVFEVVADGKTVFSKKAMGRFPEEDEVLGPLEAMKA